MWVHSTGKQIFSFESPGSDWKLGVNEERRQQNSRAKKGKKESTETRHKKSVAHQGKTRQFSEEHCRNISKGKTGKSSGHEGGKAAGVLPWWVNAKGENKRSWDKPGPEWQNGRKWRG